MPTGIVIKHFVCKLTRTPYRPGEVYLGDQKRLKELAAGGFLRAESSAKAEEAEGAGPERGAGKE